MSENYYIIGDIHGCLKKLKKIINKISREFKTGSDEIIFIGDYIDRGPEIFETVEYLVNLGLNYKVTFLEGNHEDMLKKFMSGIFDPDVYIANGGGKTIESYMKNMGDFTIPEKHKKILFNGNYFYEGDNFIVVHAGIPPFEMAMGDYYYSDLLWIREEFYKSDHRFNKTVIFGHTVTDFLHNKKSSVLNDSERNIIGIDTGAVYGGKLTCLRWPDLKIYQS